MVIQPKACRTRIYRENRVPFRFETSLVLALGEMECKGWPSGSP